MKTVVEAQAERIVKATELLAAGAYVQTAGSVYVYSDQAGVPGYSVDLATMRCSCPDAAVGFAARKLGGECKHVICARLARERTPVGVR